MTLGVAGGCLCTSGIYFFVTGKRKPVNHVIWHLFVLAASFVHYLGIYWYLEPMDAELGHHGGALGGYAATGNRSQCASGTAGSTLPSWLPIGSWI